VPILLLEVQSEQEIFVNSHHQASKWARVPGIDMSLSLYLWR
jgi:hypothetical protein